MKRKALDWLVERVDIADEDGNPIDRADLEQPEDDEPDEENEAPHVDGADEA